MTEATLYRLTDADAVMIEKAPPTETQVTQQRSEDVGETGRKQIEDWTCTELHCFQQTFTPETPET